MNSLSSRAKKSVDRIYFECRNLASSR